MANKKQSLKRVLQAEKHRIRNKWQVSRMNTFIKRVLAAIQNKNVAEAQTAYRDATSMVDKMVTKGLIHKNKAARHKSRLNKQIVAITQ